MDLFLKSSDEARKHPLLRKSMFCPHLRRQKKKNPSFHLCGRLATKEELTFLNFSPVQLVSVKLPQLRDFLLVNPLIFALVLISTHRLDNERPGKLLFLRNQTLFLWHQSVLPGAHCAILHQKKLERKKEQQYYLWYTFVLQ